MAERGIIAVIGATGAQGGGLVRALVAGQGGEFIPRAITRNIESDKAKALAADGVEVVAADLDDAASLERAFAGADGVYGVTNYWEHFSPDKEMAQAGNIARAAKAAGVAHTIWSTLEDTREWVPLDDDRMPTLMDKYKVPHFDAKGQSDRLFRDAGVPTTWLLTSAYWDNFIHFGWGPQRGPDGALALGFPMGDRKLPAIAVDDIGKCACGIFKRGSEFIGKKVGIAGEHLTGTELAAAFTQALGQPVTYNDVPPEVYRSFDFPGAADVGNMFQFKRDFSEYYCGARSVEFSRSVNPDLQTFEQWLEAHKDQVPIA
ncbi:MAG TPA: NmrA/HSCARG family protein [Gemmatimonadales bacterium]